MKNLRVALCFSGQLREWKKAEPTIKKFIQGFNIPPDIFMHAWDFNSTSHAVKLVTGIQKEEITPIQKIELEELKTSYNPKKLQVESFEKCRLIEERLHCKIKSILDLKIDQELQQSPYWLGGQYYGVNRAGLLKTNYEIENLFYYDLVIRMRYDTFLTNKFIEFFFRNDTYRPDSLTLYTTHYKVDGTFPFMRVGDIFFFSDSLTYNIISDYVNHLPYVFDAVGLKHLSPEHYFGFYIRSSYINIVHESLLDPKVARSDKYFNTLLNNNIRPYDCDV